MNFAIIGAGMAGLACADALKHDGHAVALFDKGRGPGGRMSTRRMATDLGEASFDHGAQYFTARDPRFRRQVEGWCAAKVAAPWPAAGEEAWVGTPGMNGLIRHMAAGHTVAWGSLVTGMVRSGNGWWLVGEEAKQGPFDAVILAIPAEQAAAILSLHDFAMARIALMARSQPCWTGMFVFDAPLDHASGVIRDHGDLAWAARNNAKPGRSGPEAWVVQANRAWSIAWLEAAQEDVTAQLLAALAEAAGCTVPQPLAASAHRWRYALSAGTGDGALWNAELGLGTCGDWLLGPRIECAWLSGRMLAGKISQGAMCTKVHVGRDPICT
jgi:predicted NAD/FAD-dependent oxidoreductase